LSIKELASIWVNIDNVTLKESKQSRYIDMRRDRGAFDHSKRAFMRSVATTGGLATLATLIGPACNKEFMAIASGQVRPSPAGDITIINAAIALEQKAINTYKAALQKDLMGKKPELVDVAIEFVDDHGRHRDELSRALRVYYKAVPTLIENLGAFPLPDTFKNKETKETDVLRYALKLETIASKTYFEAITNSLSTPEARGLAASILTVETQHVAVYRTVLISVLKDKGLPEDKQLVPFAFFNEQPTPDLAAPPSPATEK
jgi:rubrerythrin